MLSLSHTFIHISRPQPTPRISALSPNRQNLRPVTSRVGCCTPRGLERHTALRGVEGSHGGPTSLIGLTIDRIFKRERLL